METMSLDERKTAILREIVSAYVHHASPVSSREVSLRLPFVVSAATVRNEMATLEKEGFLSQPHVSAGRIPTMRAFRFVADLLLDDILSRHRSFHFRSEEVFRDPMAAAHRVAHEARTATFVVMGRTFAFAGFENLLAAPEFRLDVLRMEVARFLELVPFLEDRIRSVLDDVPVGIFIGDENPLLPAEALSITAVRFPRRGLLAAIGPIRMDYERVMKALLMFV